MKNNNSPYFRIFVVAGIFLILFLVTVPLPRVLVNQPVVKKSIIDFASRETGGRLYYRDADLSLFPRPRIVIYEGYFSLRGMVRCNLKALTIHLKILPLFSGDLEIARLRIDTPEFDVKLPPPASKKRKGRTPAGPGTGEESAARWPGVLTPLAPGLTVAIENGRVALSQKGRPSFLFEDIHAELDLPVKKFRAEVKCKSGFSEKIDLKAWLDPKSGEGSGYIEMAGLRPRRLAGWLLADNPWGVGESLLDLKFTFNTNGFKDLTGKVEGTIPRLTLQRGKREVTVKGSRLAGSVYLKNHLAVFTLNGLKLDSPALDLSGKVALDRAPGPRAPGAPPRVQLEVTGRDIDVDAARETGLALLGDIPLVQDIFHIVRGGPAPRVMYKTQGNSWVEAGEFENMVLEGGLRGGRLSVPVDFDLKSVYGDLVISKGVMTGTNLKARWRSAEALGGMFQWDVNDPADPFHLDLEVKSGVADLPAVFRRFVEDEEFLKEMSRISDIKGVAVGNLVLGERLDALGVRVDVSDVHLSARHPLAPHPLEIESGRLFYSGSRLDIKTLNGRFGNSSFSRIAGALNWEKTPYFQIPGREIKTTAAEHAAEIRISAAEYDAWLASFETFRESLQQLKSAGGEVILRKPRLEGELFNIESWEYQLPGEFRDLALESSRAPALLHFRHGNFKLTRRADLGKRTTFQNARVSMMDAGVTVSGNLEESPEGLENADLTLEGMMGPGFIQWLANTASLPSDFIPRAPLSLSSGRLTWERDADLSFAGDLTVNDGPKVSLDILQTPAALSVRKLDIRDNASHAAMSLDFKKGETTMAFDGALAAGTMDALLKENRLPRGSIEGNFRIAAPDGRPWGITATGALKGENLVFPWERLVPLKIDEISLVASRNTFA
ncbi:MAG: hypothetical protein GY859_33880, partial [Desulfobacterales bacterium]|nr:hypothetical protein [Desulfobacterales bacterium]